MAAAAATTRALKRAGAAPAGGYRAPRQGRSERTLEALLRATEELLATRTLAEIGIHEILGRARCSAGSFYARFASKQDLLPLLYARYDRALQPRLERRAARLLRQGGDLRSGVQRLVAATLDLYRERRLFLREMALYARARPAAIDAETRARRARVHELPVRLLGRFRAQIRHPDPERAIRVAAYVVAAAARDRILFGDAPHAALTRLALRELESALCAMAYAYLTTPPGSTSGRRPKR